jgi:arginyl-tRNA synthetase
LKGTNRYLLQLFPDKIREAGKEHSPAIIANYAYDLAKEFNQFYHEVSILKEESVKARSQRLVLINSIARVLRKAMGILGITLPDRM